MHINVNQSCRYNPLTSTLHQHVNFGLIVQLWMFWFHRFLTQIRSSEMWDFEPSISIIKITSPQQVYQYIPTLFPLPLRSVYWYLNQEKGRIKSIKNRYVVNKMTTILCIRYMKHTKVQLPKWPTPNLPPKLKLPSNHMLHDHATLDCCLSRERMAAVKFKGKFHLFVR